MSMKRVLILVVLGAQGLIAAQQAPPPNSPDNPPAQSGEAPRAAPAPALYGIVGIDAQAAEETSSNLPRIPSILGGVAPTLEFRGEQERSNYIRGGINVGATYDTNPLLTTAGSVSDNSYSVFPNVDVEQTFPRFHWVLGYAAGVTVNQRLSDRSQGSHHLDFNSDFRLTPHVNLRVAEDFSLTTGFFDSGTGADAGNGAPNASIIAPLSRQRTSSTIAEVNYHCALNDIVGASGSFYDLHFSDVPVNVILANTRTASGSAFWLHGFGRDWAGVSYRFQRVTFDPNGETLVHSIMAVDTLTLPGGFTISGFVGPELSQNKGLVPTGQAGGTSNFDHWSVTGGVEAGWQADRTSITGGYSRRINNGSGVLGAVLVQSGHGNVRRQLAPGWAVMAGFSYASNQSLTVPVPGSATSVRTATAEASLERDIGRSLGLRLGYAHDFQNQMGTTDPNFQGGAHRNRYFATLGYQWTRALGR